MANKRRKQYEKARNIVRNNMSGAKGVSIKMGQTGPIISEFTKFQSTRK